jgi:catechol 2,3-dioxygenase-like lactoylglutathione lyase family enzyme
VTELEQMRDDCERKARRLRCCFHPIAPRLGCPRPPIKENQLMLRIDHIDLAVGDVERSLRFYLAVLGPLGLREWKRFPSYRGTEEIVYLALPGGDQYLGLRLADGGEHRYYEVGLEHLAFYVDSRDAVDAAHGRCVEIGARVHFPPQEDRDLDGYYEMFVFDPDGFRIEIACGPAEAASA